MEMHRDLREPLMGFERPIVQTALHFDVEKIGDEVARLEDHLPWKEESLCLNHPENIKDPLQRWQFGCGSAYLGEGQGYRFLENDFTELNGELKGTELERLYLAVRAQGFPVGRMRLMRLAAKGAYYMHRDPDSPRVHFAVYTNEHALFVFDDGEGRNRVERIPADGYAYLMDTSVFHTGLNAGHKRRVHIVMSSSDYWVRPQRVFRNPQREV